MISKSRGQVLRVAVIFHILFAIFRDDDTSSVNNNGDSNEDEAENNDSDGDGITDDLQIKEEEISAAINFVETSMQHTLYISGRGELSDEVQCLGV